MLAECPLCPGALTCSKCDTIRTAGMLTVADELRMNYDRGDHGRYETELNMLRQKAADSLHAAITLTTDAASRPDRAELARLLAVTSQAEYTMALIDYTESRRHD